MVQRRIAAAGIAAALAVSGAVTVSTAAHGARQPSPPECRSADQARTTSTNRARYAPGAPVRVTTAITNVSGRTCQVSFSPCVSATIRGPGGQLVWSAVPLDSACAQYIVLRTLPPGQSVQRSWTWDQHVCVYSTRCPGPQVGPGTYVAQGQWGYGPPARPTSFVINGIK
jgi:hypothetical protein